MVVGRGLISLQRYSQCIVQPKPTGLIDKYTHLYVRYFTYQVKYKDKSMHICTNQYPPWRMKHQILRDVQIQTDHLIPARKLDVVINDKKKKKKTKKTKKKNENLPTSGLTAPADQRLKLKIERDKYLDLA